MSSYDRHALLVDLCESMALRRVLYLGLGEVDAAMLLCDCTDSAGPPSTNPLDGQPALALADLGTLWEGIDPGTLTDIPGELLHRKLGLADASELLGTAVVDGETLRGFLLIDPGELGAASARQRMQRRLRRFIRQLLPLTSPLLSRPGSSRTAVLAPDGQVDQRDPLQPAHPLDDDELSACIRGRLAHNDDATHTILCLINGWRMRLHRLDSARWLARFVQLSGVPLPLSATLAPQQRRACLLAAKGANTQEIAETMAISPATVKRHLNLCFKRLGVGNRAQLAYLLRDDRL